MIGTTTRKKNIPGENNQNVSEQSIFSVDSFSDEALNDPILLLQEFDRLALLGVNNEISKTDSHRPAQLTTEEDESLYNAFLNEVRQMKMSYSYKPILIKSMMQHADVNGRASLMTIVDFFLTYFRERAAKGLIIEKEDSTFVKHFNDKKVAKRTILIYPYKRFELKGMMKYDRAKEEIEIVPEIWDCVSNKVRRVIIGEG